MASGSVATVAMWRTAPPSSRSFQAVQILHERVDFVLCEDGPPGGAVRTDGHVVARLDSLRVAQPSPQILVGPVLGGDGEGRTVGERGEIGPEGSRVGQAASALDTDGGR